MFCGKNTTPWCVPLNKTAIVQRRRIHKPVHASTWEDTRKWVLNTYMTNLVEQGRVGCGETIERLIFIKYFKLFFLLKDWIQQDSALMTDIRYIFLFPFSLHTCEYRHTHVFTPSFYQLFSQFTAQRLKFSPQALRNMRNNESYLATLADDVLTKVNLFLAFSWSGCPNKSIQDKLLFYFKHSSKKMGWVYLRVTRVNWM